MLNRAIWPLRGVIECWPCKACYRWPTPATRLEDNRILAAIWQPGSLNKRLIIIHENIRHARFE